MFDRHVNYFVEKFRWIIFSLSLVWFLIVAIYAGQMGPQTKEEKFIDDDHPIMEVLSLQNNHFGIREESKTKVNFYFGVKELDDTNEDNWSAEFQTTPIFDP